MQFLSSKEPLRSRDVCCALVLPPGKIIHCGIWSLLAQAAGLLADGLLESKRLPRVPDDDAKSSRRGHPLGLNEGRSGLFAPDEPSSLVKSQPLQFEIGSHQTTGKRLFPVGKAVKLTPRARAIPGQSPGPYHVSLLPAAVHWRPLLGAVSAALRLPHVRRFGLRAVPILMCIRAHTRSGYYYACRGLPQLTVKWNGFIDIGQYL